MSSRRLAVDRVLLNRFFQGDIAFTDLGRPEKREAIYELQRRGITPEQATRLYRITVGAYTRRLTALETPKPGRPRPTPPPDQPQCQGADPNLFELVDGWPQQAALNLCRQCTVHQWCLETVRPRTSHYSGVAAGMAWVNGKPFNEPDRGRR